MKNIKLLLSFLILLFGFYSTVFADSLWHTFITPAKKQPGQWSVMLYRGTTAKDTLGEVLRLNYSGAGETVYSGEFAYALNPQNPVMNFFSFLLDQIQFAGNFAIRHDYADSENQVVPEVDGYLMLRRVNRLWQKYLYTTMAFGGGLSYAFRVPYVEDGITGNSSTRLLAFLTFEFTVALPQYPQLQLVGRIHHRSGAFGTFYPFKEKPGSNNVGIGIRYYF